MSESSGVLTLEPADLIFRDVKINQVMDYSNKSPLLGF